MASTLLDVIKLWFKNKVVNEDGSISGYIDGREPYQKFMTDLKAVGYSFSTRDSKKSKGNDGFAFQTLSVDAPIKFFGSPFTIEKRTYFQCSQGVKYYKKKEEVTSNEFIDFPTTKKKRFSIHDTKKIGCPAKMTVKRIRVYGDYTTVNKRKKKQDMLQRLRNDLLSNISPNTFERFVMFLSAAKVHTHPVAATNLNQRIHPKIVDKIHELVKNCSIVSVKDIKVHLEAFVHQMFKMSSLKPDPLNSAFFPTDRVIYNHICVAISGNKKTKKDKEWVNLPNLLSDIKHLQTACIEKAKILIDYTYSCTDKSVLSKVFDNLSSDCENFGLNVEQIESHSEENIVTEKSSDQELLENTKDVFL